MSRAVAPGSKASAFLLHWCILLRRLLRGPVGRGRRGKRCHSQSCLWQARAEHGRRGGASALPAHKEAAALPRRSWRAALPLRCAGGLQQAQGAGGVCAGHGPWRGRVHDPVGYRPLHARPRHAARQGQGAAGGSGSAVQLAAGSWLWSEGGSRQQWTAASGSVPSQRAARRERRSIWRAATAYHIPALHQ